MDPNTLCSNMVNNSSAVSERYSAMDLFLNIVSHCEEDFTIKDLEWLDRIAIRLELDMEVYNNNKHKKLENWVPKPNTRRDMEIILGIDSSWPREQINEYLDKQYDHWLPLTTHRKQEKRHHAEQMIAFIAQYKSAIG